MKKILFWFIGIVVAFLIIIFALIFTQLGNNILKPVIQGQISKYAQLPLKVEKFSLRLSSLHLLISQKDHIQSDLKMDFSLFSQEFQGYFNLNTQNLHQLNNPSPVQLNGGFQISSTFQGKLQDFIFEVISDIANSHTHIKARIKNFDLEEAQAQGQNLEINKLPIAQASYMTGRLNFQANIKKESNNKLQGKILAELQGGKVNEKLIKKDFKFDIPKTNFSLLIKADVKNDTIENNFEFFSNIGSIATKGTIEIPSLTINNNYQVALSDLSALAPILKISLRGAFKTNGIIKNDPKKPNTLVVKGNTDIAESNSVYQATLENFSLKQVNIESKKLAIHKILWMLRLPEYINAQTNLKLQANGFDQALSLDVKARIDGKTQNKPIKTAFNIDMPDKTFGLKMNAHAQGGVGKFDVDFDGPLASLDIKQADFNITKLNAQGNYNLTLPDLKQFEFITGKKLQGAIELNGKFEYRKNLYFDFASNSLGGLLKGKLENNDFSAHLNKLDSKKIFYFLQIPEILDALVEGNMDYNLQKDAGNISFLLENGKIIPNQLTQAFKQYTKFDIAKEVFKIVHFDSSIKKWIVNGKFNMESNDIKIISDYLKVDLPKNKIDTKIKLSLKNDFIYAILSGNLTSPKTQIDATNLIKSQAINAVNKSTDKAVEKYIPKESQDKVKNLLDKFLKK